MNAIAQALDKVLNTVANPARVADPDRLRGAVGGRTVLVTGASYGIGEATARRLGRRRWSPSPRSGSAS